MVNLLTGLNKTFFIFSLKFSNDHALNTSSIRISSKFLCFFQQLTRYLFEISQKSKITTISCLPLPFHELDKIFFSQFCYNPLVSSPEWRFSVLSITLLYSDILNSLVILYNTAIMIMVYLACVLSFVQNENFIGPS